MQYMGRQRDRAETQSRDTEQKHRAETQSRNTRPETWDQKRKNPDVKAGTLNGY